MARRFPAFVGLFLLVLGAGAWALWGRGTPVTLAPVVRGTAADLVYATGHVEPVVQAVVAPEVTGRLIRFMVDEGQPVLQGTPLAQLDDAEQQADVARFDALVAHDKIILTRAETLWNKRSGSREDYDQAASRLQQDEAQLAAARVRLAKQRIVAPFDGVVLRREGEVGEIVNKDTPLLTVGQTDPLRATLEVDEEDIPHVRLDQKVLLSADAFPGRVVTGTVKTITPGGDSLNKSYRVRVLLPPDSPFPVDMTVEANLVADEKANVLLVPTSAIVGGQVFVADGRQVRARAVKPGIVGSELTEVREGVAEGERVVAQPTATLTDGARVRIRASAD